MRHKRSSGDTSGLGDSLVEDMEDRTSIQFIERVDPGLTQFDPEYQRQHAQFYEPQQQPQQQQQQPIFDQPLQPQFAYNYHNLQEQPQQQHQQGYSLPPNMQLVGIPGPHFQNGSNSEHSSGQFGFASVNLGHQNGARTTSSAPEAWLVFPKGQPPPQMSENGPGSVRNFTARPVNFAGEASR